MRKRRRGGNGVRVAGTLTLLLLVGCDYSVTDFRDEPPPRKCTTGMLGWSIDPYDPENPASLAYFHLPEIEMPVGKILGLSVGTVAIGCSGFAPQVTTSYSSSDPAVAKVFESESSDGRTRWLVEALARGTTVITAHIRGEDGEGSTASKTFRVN